MKAFSSEHFDCHTTSKQHLPSDGAQNIPLAKPNKTYYIPHDRVPQSLYILIYYTLNKRILAFHFTFMRLRYTGKTLPQHASPFQIIKFHPPQNTCWSQCIGTLNATTYFPISEVWRPYLHVVGYHMAIQNSPRTMSTKTGTELDVCKARHTRRYNHTTF